MSKREDLIVDLLKEVRDDQKNHSVILIELKTDVSKNTDDLEIHIEGVQQNRIRIVELEKPREAFKLVKRWFLSLGAIAGAVYTILRLTGSL